MRERYDLKQDLLAIVATVSMECVNVGLNTLFKEATLRGMNYHVCIFYDYAIAALVGLLGSYISLANQVRLKFFMHNVVSFYNYECSCSS